jgi:DNA repair exonuclease SbcCD nuclease subunit
MDYWALGHIHARTVLRDADPCIVYPGNTQGRNVRELGARGSVVVSVRSSGTAEIEPIDTDVIRWSRREISIEGMTSIDSLLDQVATGKEAERTTADGRGAVLGLTLTGRGPLHVQFARAGVLDDLTRRMQEGEAERPDFVWIHSVETETGFPVNVAERRLVPDFVGEYLRAADSLRKAPDAAKRIRDVAASAPGFSLVRANMEKLTVEEVLASLAEAESYGLDRLLEEPD